MNVPQLWKRFPAWNPELYRDGVLEIEAGYAESGRAAAMLIEREKSIGVELREGTRLVRLDEDDNQVKGVVVEDSVGDAVSAPREAQRLPLQLQNSRRLCGHGIGRVDAVPPAVYQEVFSRDRAAGLSPQAFK